jgi:hypothetical protein
MISYVNYIDRLNELDIKIFDFQKRISYFRLSNLKSENNFQYGGKNATTLGQGILTNSSHNSIVYKLGKVELENIILKLLAKEYEGANILCDYYCPHVNK